MTSILFFITHLFIIFYYSFIYYFLLFILNFAISQLNCAGIRPSTLPTLFGGNDWFNKIDCIALKGITVHYDMLPNATQHYATLCCAT